YRTTPAPRSMLREKRPSPSAAMAQDSSTTSWAWTSLDHREPVRYGATEIPIGAYRAFSSRAAATAAATVPPSRSTETEANCAEPANVVPDITIGASHPNPPARAMTPNDTPNPATAIANGPTARAPSRKGRLARTNGRNQP